MSFSSGDDVWMSGVCRAAGAGLGERGSDMTHARPDHRVVTWLIAWSLGALMAGVVLGYVVCVRVNPC